MSPLYADSSRVMALMENAEYLGAVSVIQESLDTTQIDDKERTHLWWLKGVCLVSLNKISDAKVAFEKLLSIDPHFEAEPSTSPKILRTFHAVKHASQVMVLPAQNTIPPSPSPSITWPYWLGLGITLIGGATLGIVFGTMKSEGSMRIAFN